MKNIKLVIEYEGTNYSGWQSQDNAIGIQAIIEDAIKEVTGEKVKLIGSGRTDSKVHALGQVANFFTNSNIPGNKFKYPLNIKLPEDIKIIDSEEVDKGFHSRFDATRKRYKYIIYNGSMPRPIYRNFSYHVDRKLNIGNMKESLKDLIGTNDYKSFMGPRTHVKSTIRTIYSIEIIEAGDFIEIVIEGNSFLRHMVRIIVGTLVHIGLGKIEKQELWNIMQNKDRKLAGPTAPAQGLFLEKVYYE
ncbi:tRNA pseudouridine(38-40) synthase TruA [Wansuia hejianensis]|uniref:tRNA pseudouridine synthase A n=1 Tax=Wansuia hejianensis TaxID=2763667 RepID=A0A926IMU3_9FIRM|nr:tRNA pseudouridine(38-40) synthase TruA [Wansuia hejianensis]MBC8591554.1 tRNA pseudouridine(38-40) synthase TruA [Wansuia hejianensis]